jgi:hypothetical protein
MIDFVKQILTGQFEASLAMMNECLRLCPDEHWESKIGQGTFRWVAYHTLFFVDLYLTPNEDAFELRQLHHRGGDERGPVACVGLDRAEAQSYVLICRQKAIDSLRTETPETLAGPSGFSRYKCSRGELHLINIRHIQHHTGQLSAFLRHVDPACHERPALPWVATGWR